MDMEKCKILEQKLCRELEMLEDKYTNAAQEMSIQDLDKIDKLFHALKSMATYKAMKDAEEYMDEGFSGDNYNSGRRGRAMNGRYVSRDENPRMSGRMSYDDYVSGYGNSGHYPPVYPQGYPRW